MPGLFPPVLIDVNRRACTIRKCTSMAVRLLRAFVPDTARVLLKMRQGRTPVNDVLRARGAGEASRSKPMPI